MMQERQAFPYVFVFGALLTIFLVLAALVRWPAIDLAVSGWFGDAAHGFYLRGNVFLEGLSKIAFYGARALAFLLFLGTLAVLLGVGGLFPKGSLAKPWLFLLLALLIGPGLIVNVGLKDHVGRARPREVIEFGGTKAFTPALTVSDACARNCSFASGDAAFGFFLTSFGYVVPAPRRRRVFGASLALGVLFGGARILLGAHFLSDVLYAAVVVMAVSMALHVFLFGAAATRRVWAAFLGNQAAA